MLWRKVGHRGAPREFPGNTLKSFQAAVARGCGMVECDVRQARDGALVLAHDPAVTDMWGDTFMVAEQTSHLLGALDLGAGEGVPALTELVDWARGRCAVMADMKCGGGDVEARVIEALSALPPEEKLVPGASADSRRRFQALDPALPLSLSLGVAEASLLEAGDWEDLLSGVAAVTWEYPLLDAGRIARLHALGRSVYAWTVDDLATMRSLIEAGVDGIISNRADLMQSL